MASNVQPSSVVNSADVYWVCRLNMSHIQWSLSDSFMFIVNIDRTMWFCLVSLHFWNISYTPILPRSSRLLNVILAIWANKNHSTSVLDTHGQLALPHLTTRTITSYSMFHLYSHSSLICTLSTRSKCFSEGNNMEKTLSCACENYLVAPVGFPCCVSVENAHGERGYHHQWLGLQ